MANSIMTDSVIAIYRGVNIITNLHKYYYPDPDGDAVCQSILQVARWIDEVYYAKKPRSIGLSDLEDESMDCPDIILPNGEHIMIKSGKNIHDILKEEQTFPIIPRQLMEEATWPTYKVKESINRNSYDNGAKRQSKARRKAKAAKKAKRKNK